MEPTLPPPSSHRAAVPRRIFLPQDTRCQEPEWFHSRQRAHAAEGGRARAAESRKYQPLGSQFTCFLGVSIGNFIAPLPRWEEMKRIEIIIKSASFTRLSTAVQQNNFQGWGEPRTGSWRNPREREVENTGLGENWKRLRCLHRLRGGRQQPPPPPARVKRKVRLTMSGWRGRPRRMEEPSCFPTAVRAGCGVGG